MCVRVLLELTKHCKADSRKTIVPCWLAIYRLNAPNSVHKREMTNTGNRTSVVASINRTLAVRTVSSRRSIASSELIVRCNSRVSDDGREATSSAVSRALHEPCTSIASSTYFSIFLYGTDGAVCTRPNTLTPGIWHFVVKYLLRSVGK